MIYDLWSCADQSEQFLDQKCYMFVSNFTGSSYGLLRWANQRWEIEKNDIDLNSTFRGANFFLQRLIVRCFQAFNSIFPLERRPPFPPSPHNTPGNLCLNPPPLLSPPAQPPFYKPHTTHIPLIAPTKGLTHETSALETLYGGQFTLSTQLMKPNYHCLTEQQLILVVG